MPKTTVIKLFVGGIVAVIAGLVLGVAAVWAAFAGGVFVMDGPDVIGFNGSAFAWSMVALAVVAMMVIIGGAIVGLVSWIGALLNTAQLSDKMWFIVLLVLGVWNLGFVAMLAYVLAGPDSTRSAAIRSTTAATTTPA